MNEDVNEYTICALTGAYVEGKPDRTTWCGKHELEVGFCFCDATHASLNGKKEGRLVLCRACRDAIVKALDNGFV